MQAIRNQVMLFTGVNAVFVRGGISWKRIQVWERRIGTLGGTIKEYVAGDEESLQGVTHVLAADVTHITSQGILVAPNSAALVKYEWVQDSLAEGRLLPLEPYILQAGASRDAKEKKDATETAADEAFQSTTPLQVDLSQEGIARLGGESDEERDKWLQEFLRRPSVSFFGDSQEESFRPQLAESEMLYVPADLNRRVTEPLSALQTIYELALGDTWRAFTYKKAINVLERLPFEITSDTQLKTVEGIGPRIREKVKEILSTGHLRKLETLKSDPMVKVTLEFGSVWGIGPKTARQLYQSGHRTLADLEVEPGLSRLAKLGLKYHADISRRMPREEVSAIERFLRERVLQICPGAWVLATGSYRRGKALCGDADFVLTHPDGASHEGLLARLVERLEGEEFVVGGQRGYQADTEEASGRYSSGTDTFMGICKLPEGKHFRRIDIKVYPKSQFAFALIYFTGNDVLNRKIRHLATQKGMKLNGQGLFLRAQSSQGAFTASEPIPCETERDVFERLRLPYPEPHERNW